VVICFCVRGIDFAFFYDFNYGIVQTVWYFRIVQKMWYFSDQAMIRKFKQLKRTVTPVLKALTTKSTTTYKVGNLTHGWRQAQTCGGV
jgi:hypothetical protein